MFVARRKPAIMDRVYVMPEAEMAAAILRAMRVKGHVAPGEMTFAVDDSGRVQAKVLIRVPDEKTS